MTRADGPILAALGAGQLGRMLALAAAPMGVRVRCLDPLETPCAADVAAVVRSDWTDPESLARLAAGVAASGGAATFEFERVPVASLEILRSLGVPCRPGPASLAAGQDRLAEKRLFDAVGVATAPWAPAGDPDSLALAVRTVGTPGLLKLNHGGYDGKGQVFVDDPADAPAAHDRLGAGPCIYERRVAFRRELSLVAVRTLAGDLRAYPLVENEHRRGILFRTVAPAPSVGRAVERDAADAAFAMMESLDHVGVFTVEFFEGPGGELLANETAPRVHNSGHWTIEGAPASQFENHARAVLGWPAGEMSPRAPTVMFNLIGSLPDPRAVLAVPGASLHVYGKTPRPGRKIGHVTLANAEPGDERTRELAAVVEGSFEPSPG